METIYKNEHLPDNNTSLFCQIINITKFINPKEKECPICIEMIDKMENQKNDEQIAVTGKYKSKDKEEEYKKDKEEDKEKNKLEINVLDTEKCYLCQNTNTIIYSKCNNDNNNDNNIDLNKHYLCYWCLNESIKKNKIKCPTCNLEMERLYFSHEKYIKHIILIEEKDQHVKLSVSNEFDFEEIKNDFYSTTKKGV